MNIFPLLEIAASRHEMQKAAGLPAYSSPLFTRAWQSGRPVVPYDGNKYRRDRINCAAVRLSTSVMPVFKLLQLSGSSDMI
jgi:hypothetical protein